MSSSFMSSKTQQKSLPSDNGLSNLQSFRSNTHIKIDNPSAPFSSQKLSQSQTEHNSNIYNGMLKYSHDYAQKSKILMSLLNNTCSILKQVRETNKQRWDLYYPFSSQTPGLKSLYNDKSLGSDFGSNTQMNKFKQKVY